MTGLSPAAQTPPASTTTAFTRTITLKQPWSECSGKVSQFTGEVGFNVQFQGTRGVSTFGFNKGSAGTFFNPANNEVAYTPTHTFEAPEGTTGFTFSVTHDGQQIAQSDAFEFNPGVTGYTVRIMKGDGGELAKANFSQVKTCTYAATSRLKSLGSTLTAPCRYLSRCWTQPSGKDDSKTQ